MKLLRMALEGMSVGQKLYHYASMQYPVLKTRALTNKLSAEELREGREDVTLRKMPGPYYDHISFFFEPPPLEKMSQIFDKEHPFWYPGHEIYEHIVSIDDLPSFKYLMTESPDVNAFFYDPRNEALSDEAYFAQIYAIRKKNKEIGSTVNDLRAVIQQLRGETEKGYLALKTRPNFDQIRNKYAATVPHLMLYPEGGQIDVLAISPVVVK